jgi:hypothetical protein
MSVRLERRRPVVHSSQGFISMDHLRLGEEKYLQIILAFIPLSLASTFLFLQNAKGREIIILLLMHAARTTGVSSMFGMETCLALLLSLTLGYFLFSLSLFDETKAFDCVTFYGSGEQGKQQSMLGVCRGQQSLEDSVFLPIPVI